MYLNKPSNRLVLISEFKPSMRGFDCEFIVLNCAIPTKLRDGGQVCKFKVSDKSGSIVLTLWGDSGEFIKPGDILRLEGAEAKLFKNTIFVTTSRYGKIKRIGENNMIFNELPFFSEVLWLTEEEHQMRQNENQPL
ncbi:hypothetical protein BB559_007355 [Furculomyces boomerangus]|uniref:Single-stranded DNA binding protein Ssb-like OB fold domain-containing protein n=2 Tax=Harpellales TaxID=61421 RepID=A0A2T9XXP8_9FUNG|nr:hypothetical protein BB559_007355 [Furculomyces boomerangus]PVZ97093.1 hypothetical protein BB558_006968 [Smittium angustum]PVZ99810.1 hypothetical protein BB558_004148 [Smittium angustum]